MCYETDFLLLLPYMRILVHALYFLSLHSDPLTLLPSCLTPAPRARKLRYHQLIAGWSSACKALDESESWSVLWKAVCCQIVLSSGTCPHPISSPRFEDIPPRLLSLLHGRNSRALCCSFFPSSKGAQSWRTLPCPTSFVGNAAVLVREKSSLDCWRLLAGVAEFIFFVTVRTEDLRQMGSFLLSGRVWRVCTFPWGPGQVPSLLFSEIGSFHHRKWDHVCKELEKDC